MASPTGAMIDVKSILSDRNYDILTSIIATLFRSRPFSDVRLLGLARGLGFQAILGFTGSPVLDPQLYDKSS